MSEAPNGGNQQILKEFNKEINKKIEAGSFWFLGPQASEAPNGGNQQILKEFNKEINKKIEAGSFWFLGSFS